MCAYRYALVPPQLRAQQDDFTNVLRLTEKVPLCEKATWRAVHTKPKRVASGLWRVDRCETLETARVTSARAISLTHAHLRIHRQRSYRH